MIELANTPPMPVMPQPQQAERRRLKVALCIPSMDRVHADFMVSLMGLVGHTLTSGMGFELHLINHVNSVITDARNQLVNMALQWEAEWLMWLDSDLTFPQDTLLGLIARDKDIIGGTYNMRAPPYQTLGQLTGDEKDLSGGGIHEAVFLPGGIMLVRADVYRKIPAPWYEDTYRLDENGKKTMNRVGEDVDFCWKATAAGYKVWCDLDLTDQVAHLGQIPVTCKIRPIPQDEATAAQNLAIRDAVHRLGMPLEEAVAKQAAD